MTQEIYTPKVETEAFKKPSRVRKAVTGILGGLGIFAATNIYGAAAGIHNDNVREVRAQKARIFNLETAEVTPIINLDKNGEEMSEEGVPVAFNE